MSESPLVSVIVPVYNVERYLDGCVASVLSQTYTNLEMILVDDGSTDASGAMCDAWAARDPRVHAYHVENGGAGAARNFGIDRAGGGFLAFVDSDDWIEPGMYERLIGLALESGADIVGCANLTEREDGTVSNNFSDLETGMTEGKYWILEILYQGSHAWGAVWNKVFRRDFFAGRRFPQLSHLEDYVLTLDLFAEANGVYFCAEPLYHHRLRDGSLTNRGFHDDMLSVLDTAESIRRNLTDAGSGRDVLAGADYFVWLMYSSVLWGLRRSGFPRRSEIVAPLRGAALRSLRAYLVRSEKRRGDAKRCAMLLMGLFL